MANLDALYQEMILDHNRRPRNYRAMVDADRTVEGRNPLCGDEVTLWVKLDGDRVSDASFQARGCAISRASASLMTAAIKGKTVAEAEELFDRFHELVTGKLDPSSARASLGSLVALGGVAKFPQRVKCASMAWHALHSALAAAGGREDEARGEEAGPRSGV
jgi:nitrogen fixation NifU-like protein